MYFLQALDYEFPWKSGRSVSFSSLSRPSPLLFLTSPLIFLSWMKVGRAQKNVKRRRFMKHSRHLLFNNSICNVCWRCLIFLLWTFDTWRRQLFHIRYHCSTLHDKIENLISTLESICQTKMNKLLLFLK